MGDMQIPTTPALLIDAGALERNLATMAAALPGPRVRPHVQAPKF
jgi:D-serine deaminase-like pyridoxal phosphate-dependent protein